MTNPTESKVQKTFTIETYGCQMNEYDTELVRSILAKENYTFVKSDLEADIVMLNTCAIRENAHRKVFGRVHDIRHKREERSLPNPMIGLLGCMVTNLRKELLEDQSLNIDFIAGPDSYKKLPDLIREAQATGLKTFDATLSEYETYSDVFPSHQAGAGINAWLAVSRGCNNFCTFCVVPYTRGRERSRPVENILEETRRLAGLGFKQVTLLGQNVNSYRHEQSDFADLMQSVSTVEGIERVRFTSPHPKDFPEKLLKVIAANPKLCKHIHLPVQSGSSRVLELMDRTYTKEEFLQLVDKVRAVVPGAALTTDIIVGFPTETEADFQETLDVLEKVRFDSAFIFKYSERKGTIAQRKFPDDIPPELKTRRIVAANEVQSRISFEKNEELIGSLQEILIDGNGTQRYPGSSQGRTDGNKLTFVPDNSITLGKTLKVKITGATPHALKGEVIA